MQAPFVDPFGVATPKAALPLVGRETEMQWLRTVLKNARSAPCQGPRAAMISGEMGIGKSRLLEELAREASEQGLVVFQGYAYASGSLFPYLPFIEALRPFVRTASEAELRRYTGLEDVLAESGPGSSADVSLTGEPLIAALGQLFPELPFRLRVVPQPEPLTPDQARFRLFDAVATLLERVSLERAVVFCLDNMHLADSMTLELTMYLTVRLHESRVALIGATRPPQTMQFQADDPPDSPSARPAQAEQARQLLAELMRQGLLLMVPLGALPPTAAMAHIRALLPGVLAEGLAEELLARAGGNPFYLEELVRALCLSQRLVMRAGMWQTTAPIGSTPWPERITLALQERLQGLACRELLQVAALLGRTFALPPLARACGLSEERARTLLDEALQASLLTSVLPASSPPLVEEPAGPPLFAFNQGMVQEMLAAEIATPRRRQLHGALGAALEEHYGALAPAHAAELARQYVLSDQHEAALRWSLRAGADALHQQAQREALHHLRVALRLLESGVETPERQAWPTRAQVYLGLGETWLKLGELAAAA
ncbi:MAG TPA: AAA family ATPase, partial [Ktedonobacteraceae bacterium]|nr:AAA family ATPase [Ktedonobacteraceae bacterium]